MIMIRNGRQVVTQGGLEVSGIFIIVEVEYLIPFIKCYIVKF